MKYARLDTAALDVLRKGGSWVVLTDAGDSVTLQVDGWGAAAASAGPVHESEFDPLGMVEPRKRPELRAVPLGEAQAALQGIMGKATVSPRAVSGLGVPTPDPAADLLKRADELDTIAAQHKADAERAWCTANGYREAAAIVQRAGAPEAKVYRARDLNPDAKDYSGC